MNHDSPERPPQRPSGRPAERALSAPTVSCVFVCHDGAGRILLARRSEGARDEPGTWDTGAGALEHGESFESAVRREVREEYLAEALSVETLGVRNILRGDPVSHWVAVLFAVRVDPDRVAVGEPHKFDALGWFTPDALPRPQHSQLAGTLAVFEGRQPPDTPA
ncbi:NUDIX domain-containing protein [Streptacidiphilus carbonis]|jgi:8-oxo-dGTP diphosphatase|uniref:NUDIX domain-containing protein n=1 Tax=Streptacidiphilus carbonis TaxID=105422 RepID=UPI0009FC7CAD|nr:NUDIX domain-containing protein [Streptacidiphilus carbonis]